LFLQPLCLSVFMGCCAAVSFKQNYHIHGEIPSVLFILYLVLVIFTTLYPSIWKRRIETDQCTLWKHDPYFKFQPSGLITVTSIVWAPLIQWLACAESRGDCSVLIRVLQFDVFKSLSDFSLQLYLSHHVTGSWLDHAMNVLGIKSWFSKEFHLIYVYAMSYALYSYVQPLLDNFLDSHSHVVIEKAVLRPPETPTAV